MTEGHQLTAVTRTTVAAVMNVTGENHSDIARAIGLSRALVNRRQHGRLPWKLVDIGHLADHWHIRPGALLDGPSDAMEAANLQRINGLRRTKNLPPLTSLPTLPPAAPTAPTAASAA